MNHSPPPPKKKKPKNNNKKPTYTYPPTNNRSKPSLNCHSKWVNVTVFFCFFLLAHSPVTSPLFCVIDKSVKVNSKFKKIFKKITLGFIFLILLWLKLKQGHPNRYESVKLNGSYQHVKSEDFTWIIWHCVMESLVLKLLTSLEIYCLPLIHTKVLKGILSKILSLNAATIHCTNLIKQ